MNQVLWIWALIAYLGKHQNKNKTSKFSAHLIFIFILILPFNWNSARGDYYLQTFGVRPFSKGVDGLHYEKYKYDPNSLFMGQKTIRSKLIWSILLMTSYHRMSGIIFSFEPTTTNENQKRNACIFMNNDMGSLIYKFSLIMNQQTKRNVRYIF